MNNQHVQERKTRHCLVPSPGWERVRVVRWPSKSPRKKLTLQKRRQEEIQMIKSWESRRRWRSMYRVWRPGTKAERTFLVWLHHWRRLSTRWEWVRGMCARCIDSQLRWTWLGHVLRMKKGRHPLEALSWAPPGKRHRGRPLPDSALGGGPSRTRWK